MTRIGIAGFQHETNTLAPFPTTLADFEAQGSWPPLTRGDAVMRVFPGLNIPISGFIEACPHEMVPILWASAEPGGYVDQDAFDAIVGEISDAVANTNLDALYLDLHGAMVTRAYPDAEAEIMRRIRTVTGDDFPIAVSLDLHGNLSRAFFERATVVTIYRTYPHTDMAETGARAARLLDRALAEPLAGAFRHADYVTTITAQSTEHEPARSLYAAIAKSKAAAADLAMGFPPADIPDLGFALLVYDPDPALAESEADRLLEVIEAAEDRFDPKLLSAAEAVDRAMGATGPIVIADPQDNPGAGGTGDTTGLLQALLDAGVADAVLSMLFDPDAAAAAHAAGEGAEATLSLGGRFAEFGPPLTLPVRIEALSDGIFMATGPFYGGSEINLGPVARLRVVGTGVQVVVGSRRAQNADQGFFRVVGLEPADHQIVCVKSAVHFIADYKRIARDILFAVAPGANPCDLAQVPYRRLRPGMRFDGKPLS